MSDDKLTIDYKMSPTAAAFHADDSFIRAVLGQVGSGKTSMMCMEILMRAMAQKPHKGVRRSRWALIRQTYPELKSTTLETFQDWVPQETCPVVMSAPIKGKMRQQLPDGTIMELEVIFLALDRAEDVKKLKSLELTGAFMNECSELDETILKFLRGRVGRYPAKKVGGPSWYGIIMDTNPPTTRHWFYRLFETDKPEGHKLFRQPAPLIYHPHKGGMQSPKAYSPNPDAENVEFLQGGYDYYYRQIPGASEDYIRVMVLGEYGATFDGRPVFPQFDDRLHIERSIPRLHRSGQLIVGIDWGLFPAAVVTQMSPNGRLEVIDEMVASDCTLEDFVDSYLVPVLINKYKAYNVLLIGDPAGGQRNALYNMNSFQYLKSRGFAVKSAPTNEFMARKSAVDYFLGRNERFKLYSNCPILREGFQRRLSIQRETERHHA